MRLHEGPSRVKLPALKARGFPDRNKPQFIALLDPALKARGLRSAPGQPSILEYARAIGHLQRLLDILLDEHDGDAPPGQQLYHSEYLSHRLWREAVRRLIEHAQP